jgi:hypothetical protein
VSKDKGEKKSPISVLTVGGSSLSKSGYYSLTRLDRIAAPAVAAFAAVILYLNIYSAINWDDLLYMSLAQCTWPEAWILNRYAHIYILKFFFALAGDAIRGARFYWCFMFFATSVLTYWSAKILAGKKGVIVAVIAVLLVWIWPMFGREAGSPLSDFTVMLLISLAVFIYLAFLSQRTKYSHWLIMLLGFLLFWAVKSKETGICMAVLFLGLGRTDGSFSISRFIKDICWVLCGIVIGSLLLMACDLIFMGDFFFSLWPTSLKGLFVANLGPPVVVDTQNNIIESWFAFFTTRPIFFIFILYLLVGWSNLKNYSIRENIIWIIPWVLMLFLTFSRRAWSIVPRYFCPAMPVMAIWAAQFFSFDFDGRLFFKNNLSISRKAAGFAVVIAAFVLALLFAGKVSDIALYYKLNADLTGRFPNVRWENMTPEELFYMLCLMPVAIAGLLITAVVSKKRGLAAVFFTALFLFALVLPAYSDGRKLLQTSAVKSKWRFAACRAFKGDLKFDKNTKMLVSKNVFGRTWLLGRDAQSHCHIFNIFFNQKLRYDQFIDGSEADILKGDYDYAILIADEQTVQMSKKPEFQRLLAEYELKQADALHPSGEGAVPLILLKKR